MNIFLRKSQSLALILVMISVLSFMQVSTAHSSDSKTQNEAMSFLKEVVNLNTSTYNATLVHDSNENYTRAGHIYRDMHYVLNSTQSELDMSLHLVDQTFVGYLMDVVRGSPNYNNQPSTNVTDAAKTFLSRYQEQASYCDSLKQMLDTISAYQNSTITTGNATLKVSVLRDSTALKWSYTVNSVEAPIKCMFLEFRHGNLYAFNDYWGLYRIGNTDAKLSKADAMRIAMNYTRSYKYTLTNPPTEVTPQFDNSRVEANCEFANDPEKPRGGDCLTLYPWWKVVLYFDRTYQGNYYGVSVCIWADTGGVEGSTLQGFYGLSPISPGTDSMSPIVPVLLVAVPVTSAFAFGVYRSRRKPFNHKNKHMTVRRFLSRTLLFAVLRTYF